MDYQKMADSDSSQRGSAAYNIRRVKTLTRCLGLIILGVLITIVQFDKIDSINSFVDEIGSCDNVRNTYLTNITHFLTP